MITSTNVMNMFCFRIFKDMIYDSVYLLLPVKVIIYHECVDKVKTPDLIINYNSQGNTIHFS